MPTCASKTQLCFVPQQVLVCFTARHMLFADVSGTLYRTSIGQNGSASYATAQTL